jgi:hypothetical protein
VSLSPSTTVSEIAAGFRCIWTIIGSQEVSGSL